MTALLGRRRWQRRRGVDEVPGYRNGYGRLRKLSLTSGTVEVRRPRVRGLEERFESRILPLFKQRGMNCPSVVVGDGHLGIWGALAEVFPKAKEQRCWNHRIVNVLDKLPKSRQAEGKLLLTAIPYAQTRAEVERLKGRFQDWCKGKGFEGAAELIEYDWERMVTFYDFPKAHWKHLRTTNIIESPFAAVRLRTAAAKRYKKVANATAVIWKTLMVAESRFRRLDAPHLVAEVAEGAVFVDGERFLKSRREKVAA